MANNGVVIEVLVTDKGTNKITIKDLNQLGNSIEKVRVRQTAANKTQKDFFDTQNKGVIGTANSTKSFSKLAETMGKSRGVVGAYATLAANIFAVTAAFNALRNAAQVEQVFLGLEALGQRTGKSLGVAAKNVQELSGYSLSAEQAMRSTAQVMSGGFNTKQLERITVAAKDASFALGRNMTDSMDRLTRGILKLEPELLDELGLMTRIGDATTAYAITVGKTANQLTSFERKTAFANAALAEAELKFSGLSEAAGDSKAFDQLAATFQNLVQSILSVVNTIAKPLASLFASSPGTLLGGMVLFGATISKQLLPGLASLAQKSLVSAAATREQAKASRDAAAASLAEAKAANQAGIANAKKEIKSVAKGPKGYNSFAAEMAAGTATVEARNKAMSTLNRSIAAHEVQLRKITDIDKRADRQAIIDDLKAQKAAIENLRTAETNAASTNVSETAKVVAAREKARVATIKAFAEAKSANALVLASQGQYIQSFTELRGAIFAYAKAQKTAGTASLTMLGAVKTATFAAAGGVRVLGAAFLNMIPVIGQIIFAAGLLYSGWKWLTKGSKDQQEFNSKLEDLNKILDDFSKRGKEYERFVNSSVPASLRQAQAFNLVSNSVSEIAAAYEDALAARKKLGDEENSYNLASAKGWLDLGTTIGKSILQPTETVLNGYKSMKEAFLKWQTGIKSSEVDFLPFRSSDIVNDPGFIAFKKLYTSDIPLIQQQAEKAINKEGGLAKINLKPASEQILAFGRAVRNSKESLSELGPATASLQTAFTELEKSTSTFIKSSIITTQYDQLVTDFNEVNKSVGSLSVALLKAGYGTGELVDALSGIGTQSAQFLDVATQKAIDTVRTIDPQVKELLKKQEELKGNFSIDDKRQLTFLQNRLANQKIILANLDQELRSVGKLLQSAQEEERIGKARLALENARAKSVGTIYDKTGAGLRMQYEQEDRIRNIQIQQNNLQAEIQKRLIESNKIKLDSLRIELNRFRIEARRELIGKEGLEEKKWEMAQKLFDTVSSIEQVENSIRDQEASIKSLSLQNQAIKEEALNTAQRTTRINERDVAITNEQNAKLQEARGIQRDIAETTRKINILYTGRSATLADELASIKAQRDAQVDALKTQSKSSILALEAQLKVQRADNERNKGNEDLLRSTEAQIAAEKAMALGKEEVLRLQAEQAKLEKVMFDDRKEGLEWQQQSLDYLQKALDAQNSLTDTTNKQVELQERLSLRRRGLQASDEYERTLEIRAATEAYKLAVSEISLKKGLIDLEYALLDAQRQALIEQLQARKSALQESNRPEDANRIAQLNETINRLNSVDVGSISASLKQGLDATLKNAKITLETVLEPVAGSNNKLISRMEGFRKSLAAELDGRRTLANAKVAEEVKVINPGPVEAAKMVETVTDRLVTTNTNLIAKIQEWIVAVQAQVGTTAARGTIYDAAAYARSQGAIVTELKGETSVGKHAKNSRHYSGNAFDVNMASGMGEYNNPVIREKMDKLAKDFEAQGFRVLWKIKGHFDHMHVEIAKGAEAAFSKIVSDVGAVSEQANRKIEAANDNSNIVVTGKANPKPVLTEEVIQNPALDRTIAPIDVTLKNPVLSVEESLRAFEILSEGIKENLATLGPNGAVVLSLSGGMSKVLSSSLDAMKILDKTSGDTAKGFADRFTAMATVASSALASIQSILTATSDAKIANIDKEIAAEQRRDGKSADSLAKIAAMDKKKDEIAKKQFNINKKLMMAQAIIATAAGVAQALTLGPIAGPMLAGLIGAMGAAQLAIISGTSYQSTSTQNSGSVTPPTLTIGKRGDSVDLAKNNSNLGGELGYLRGRQGVGSNASNYSIVGSAYGGALPRGYGNTAYAVGEKGPEILTPETPISITPVNDNQNSQPIRAEISIQALDSTGVAEVLHGQRGNIISMLREAANANGQRFLENVNVDVYTRPNVSKL